MNEKIEKLKRDETIKIYDKNLIETLADKLEMILKVKQEESCFEVSLATDEEIKRDFKKWCRINKHPENSGFAVREYFSFKKVIWG